jgi:hypothetical protein
VLFPDVGDGPSADRGIHVRERSLNARVAPRGILGGHPDHPVANLCRRGWPSGTAPQIAIVRVSGITMVLRPVSVRLPSVFGLAPRRTR